MYLGSMFVEFKARPFELRWGVVLAVLSRVSVVEDSGDRGFMEFLPTLVPDVF